MNRRLSSWALAAFTGLLLAAPPSWAKDDTGLDLVQKLNEAFVQIAEKVSPTVVVINVVQRVPSTDDAEEDGAFDTLPPSFWKKFHEQFKRPEKTHGEGSGIIIRENGYILTNRHVIDDAETIDVRLRDGRNFKGTVRGVDPQSDVAVIHIDAQGLPVARLADSSKTRVGEFAIAVGTPYNLDYSVTFGHVSAKGRSSIIDGPEGAAMDQEFIQTDALINPGNSGGPLVNVHGEVIGINTLIRGLHTGIGFAIPSSLAKEVSDQLIEKGKFTRAWLGISILALRDQPDLREIIKGVDEGVVVSAIMPQGPAAKSDLKPTDIIIAVDGQKVATAQELRNQIRNKPIGQPITLNVFRKGKNIDLKLSPGEWVQPAPPSNLAKASPAPRGDARGEGERGKNSSQPTVLGITAQELTRELASRFGVDSAQAEGVLVAAVEKNSPAEASKLKPGDIITSVNLQPVTSKKQFDAAVKKADLAKGILINLVSDNTPRFEILKSP
jgi:serine protease Do